jgi:hypothetical protein
MFETKNKPVMRLWVFMGSLFSALAAEGATFSYSPPANWPQKHIAMGAAIQNATGIVTTTGSAFQISRQQTDTFPGAQLESVFIYGSANGSSVQSANANPTVVYKVANLLTNEMANASRKVVPVLVLYTNSVSDHTTRGASPEIIDSTTKKVTTPEGMGNAFLKANMIDYFKLMITDLKTLSTASNNNTNTSAPSIIINPDFLGTLFQQIIGTPSNYANAGSVVGLVDSTWDPKKNLTTSKATTYLMNNAAESCVIGGVPAWSDAAANYPASSNMICVNDAVNAAISSESVGVPPQFTNDVSGYIQAVNWLIKQFSPSGTTIGVQANIISAYCTKQWNCTQDKLWPHYISRDTSSSSTATADVKSLADQMVLFWTNLGVFSGSNPGDFIAFDKYGINGASPYIGTIKNGYLFNYYDMKFLVTYIGEVTTQLKTPAMLWQLPGGHMETLQLKTPTNGPVFQYNTSAMSTEAQYIFGDSKWTTALPSYAAGLAIADTTTNHYNYTGSASEYLTNYLALTASTDSWANSHIDDLVGANVFAILWGSGTCSTSLGTVPPLVPSTPTPDITPSATACGDQLDTIIPVSPRSAAQADIDAAFKHFIATQDDNAYVTYGRQWLQNKVNNYYSTVTQ